MLPLLRCLAVVLSLLTQAAGVLRECMVGRLATLGCPRSVGLLGSGAALHLQSLIDGALRDWKAGRRATLGWPKPIVLHGDDVKSMSRW